MDKEQNTTNETKKNNSSNNKKKQRKISLLYVLGGGILTEDFILKHTRMIIFVAVLIFFFIANRYTCLMKLREIDKLEQKLRDARFEALSISTELTSNSRQSQVELLIKEQGLDLQTAKNPPYELYK